MQKKKNTTIFSPLKNVKLFSAHIFQQKMLL